MSVIEVPDGSLFGRDNLPYGVFSAAGGTPRVGARLGDTVTNLAQLIEPDFATLRQRDHGGGQFGQ